MPTEFMKRLVEKGSAATLEHFAKAQIAGRDTGLRQVDWVFAIQKFADKRFPDKLSPQQRFARMLDTPEGKLLSKAMDFAPPPSYEPEPVEKEEPRHIGPHHARLHVEAVSRQRERGITYAAAVSEVINADPTLSAAVRDEHLQHALGAMSGSGGVTHTLSVDEAQNKEPARSFRGTGYDRDIAEKQLQKLADQRRAAHPGESAAVAFTKVLTDPGNAALRRAALSVA